MFYSAQYSRVQKRNSYTIAFKDDSDTLKYGQIQYFTVCSGIAVGIVKLLKINETSRNCFKLTFNSLDFRVFPVCVSNVIKVVPVHMIKEKCIFISLSKCYIDRLTSKVCMD